MNKRILNQQPPNKPLMTAARVALFVTLHCWWVYALPALTVVFGLILGWCSNNWGSFNLFFNLFLHATVGLTSSYAIHEAGHALALSHCSGVTHITFKITLLRSSLQPHGTITARQAVLAAIAGAAACLCAAAVLFTISPLRSLAWWHLGHVVFLLPFFGDGRSIIRLCSRRSNALSPAKR